MNNGWSVKPLGEVCQNLDSQRKPITKSKRVPGEVPYYGASGVVDYVEGHLFDEDLLLVSEDGANLLARTYPIAFSISGKAWVNNHAHVLRFPDIHSQRFIEYYLNSISLTPWVSGMAQPKLNQRKLNSIPIPDPSPEEKYRIVAMLDDAFAAIDRAKENTEKNIENSRELFEAYLNRVFTEKGSDWEEAPLGEVVTFQGGSQPPKSAFSNERKPGYIRLIQIRDYKSNKHIVFIPEKDARRKCDSTDVMIGRYGPPLFQILRGIDGAYNVALMKAIPDESRVSKDYLFYFLKNGRLLSYVIHSSNRAAGQAGVNKKTLTPYPIPFPKDLSEQASVVTRLEGLMADTEHLQSIYAKKLTALEELKQSLLEKAFTGQLTGDMDEQEVANA